MFVVVLLVKASLELSNATILADNEKLMVILYHIEFRILLLGDWAGSLVPPVRTRMPLKKIGRAHV